MLQSIVIHLPPVASYKCADKEKERGLWLVEIRNDGTHNMEAVTRSNYNLCALVQNAQPVFVQVSHDILQSLHRCHTLRSLVLVRFPLVHVQFRL